MFTSEERQQLDLFCSVCDTAAGSRFMRTFFDQPHHIFVGTLPDGRVVDEYPRFDDDDFRAFLTHYRKLRLNEPTQLNRIINILKWKGNSADRSTLDYLKSEIREEGRCWWGTMHPAEGYTEELTQEWLEDRILNGEVFHSDLEKKHDLARVTGIMPLPKAVAFLNYMRFARTVLGCAQKVAGLIRERGYVGQG
jgi:hypothetical protein